MENRPSTPWTYSPRRSTLATSSPFSGARGTCRARPCKSSCDLRGCAVDGAATAGLGRNLNRIPISRVLGLSEDGLNGRCPMQEVSMGLPAIIVPLNALGALKRCQVDRESGTSSWWRVRRPRTSSSSASSRTRRLISLLACATTTMASRKIGPPAVPPDTSPGTLWNTATLARTHRCLARVGVRDRTPFFAVSTGEEIRKRDRRLRRQEGADGREGRALVSPARVDRKLVACPHEGEARTIGT